MSGAKVGEDCDGIDGGQRGDEGSAVLFGIDGTAFTLESTDGGVAIDADEKKVAEVARGFEVSDVAEVEEVKATVGDDELFAAAKWLAPGAEIGVGDDFREEVQEQLRDVFGNGGRFGDLMGVNVQ